MPSEHVDVSSYGYPTDSCARALGSYITLENGERVLDACCGLTGASLGYAHPPVMRAIKAQIASGAISLPGYTKSKSQDNALSSLMRIAPNYINKVHVKGCNGGSTSVEQAIKHALADRPGDYILTMDVGHFGQTIATNVSAPDCREFEVISKTYSAKTVSLFTSDCMSCPYGQEPRSCSAECLSSEFERLDYLCLHKGIEIAAFLFEPISGASGCRSWPIQFWSSIQEWCRKKGIFMIADESQTFGRLGGFFAIDTLKIEADAICLAKGISGIGVPGCGALLLASKSASINRYQRSLTWGGSPISCSAIHATICEMSRNDFFGRTSKVAEELNLALHYISRKNPEVISGVRGQGFMLGLQMGAAALKAGLGSQVVREARKRGVYMRECPLGASDVIEIRPRINITKMEASALIKALLASINAAKDR